MNSHLFENAEENLLCNNSNSQTIKNLTISL